MPKNNLSKLKDHAAAATGRNCSHGGGGGRGGGSNNTTRCRKHPKHKQSPGVCSVCLREKLSNLVFEGSFTNTKATASSSTRIIIPSFSSSSLSSLSSYYSSASSLSSSSSPYFPRKKTSISSMSSLLFKRRSTSTTTNVLTTSTSSLADADHHSKNKSHLGFWSKLMMNGRGKEIVEETLRCSTSTADHQTITTT